MYAPGLLRVTLNHIQLAHCFQCLLFYGAGKAAIESHMDRSGLPPIFLKVKNHHKSELHDNL